MNLPTYSNFLLALAVYKLRLAEQLKSLIKQVQLCNLSTFNRDILVLIPV